MLAYNTQPVDSHRTILPQSLLILLRQLKVVCPSTRAINPYRTRRIYLRGRKLTPSLFFRCRRPTKSVPNTIFHSLASTRLGGSRTESDSCPSSHRPLSILPPVRLRDEVQRRWFKVRIQAVVGSYNLRSEEIALRCSWFPSYADELLFKLSIILA